MEVGEKLKELNMTVDEIDRLTKALRDEKFREMLRDYAQEISDPENKKRYEEEIKLLEQERGHSVEFIHPEPFRALRTSQDGKHKCFINICANDKVGKPECKCGVSEDGRRGQSWTLPHSLHPGRQDIDTKGNKIMIYDVIFHPDTLHIASKNKRFMDMVEGTAIQGIQSAFKVTLDKNNVREMNTKYKGTPRPCVIRKPIPGYKAREPSEMPDPLAFPYPDENRPTASSQTEPTDSPATRNSDDAKPKSFQIRPEKAKEPTRPNYAVKYRSFVDLQDFRCSRDSARSPRPKEIVVTVDMPLLKSVADTSLEVKDKILLLDSKKPAYRLELPLAYPVDEDKAQAKFNKQRGQLTVTLPVLPSGEAFDFTTGPATTVSDAQSGGAGEGKGKEGEEDKWKEQERGSEREDEEEDPRQRTRAEKGEGEEGGEQVKKGQESVVCEEEKSREVDVSVEEEVRPGKQESVEEEEEKQESGKKDGNQSSLIAAEHSCGTREEGEANLYSCLESKSKMKTSDIQEETEKTKGGVEGNVQLQAAFLKDTSSEESHAATTAPSPTTAAVTTSSHGTVRGRCDKANESSRGVSGSGKQEESEDVDEDDLPTEQIFQTPEPDGKSPPPPPPPALLREVDKDGNEKVISDHSTCAGFIFQNTLMYELD